MDTRKQYPTAFETWWHEHKSSEELYEQYQHYRLENKGTGNKLMCFKRWALGVYQED